MVSMHVLLTLGLPVGLTAAAAWRLYRPRPATPAQALRALGRIVPAEPRPALRLVVDNTRRRTAA